MRDDQSAEVGAEGFTRSVGWWLLAKLHHLIFGCWFVTWSEECCAPFVWVETLPHLGWMSSRPLIVLFFFCFVFFSGHRDLFFFLYIRIYFIDSWQNQRKRSRSLTSHLSCRVGKITENSCLSKTTVQIIHLYNLSVIIALIIIIIITSIIITLCAVTALFVVFTLSVWLTLLH